MSQQAALQRNLDQDGNQIQFDIREDEEQGVKLTQIVELLLAAGYFRARIKGLSPFDKVVGGMTWCITTCSFDVDVDLLFQENSTIGQKITLTEKIVAVLPKMKCPHRIEPHQIQGLDFIHIFPVVQWLVKKAIATREEMGDYVRAYSISQFNKHHTMPEDLTYNEKKDKARSSIQSIQYEYRPQRKYRRHAPAGVVGLEEGEENRVQSTLLEYGHRRGLTKSAQHGSGAAASGGKAAIPGGAAAGDDVAKDDLAAQEEEKRIHALLSGMSEATDGEGRLTASAVGSIVGLQSQEIQQMAEHYAEKQAELESMEKLGQTGGVQHHKRQVTSISKQIQSQRSKLQQLEDEHKKAEEKYKGTQQSLAEAESLSARIAEEFEKLNALETEENQGVLEKLRQLVAMNESLKKQEQQFKQHCKEEKARLEENLRMVQTEGGGGVDGEDEKQRLQLIEKQYDADREKLQKIRLLLARKNREISALQRKIDEVPSRAELSQYQRRFVELYNQVAKTHKETKQFYTLYNTLDDTKLYLNKEVSLLNSIYDNFEQAMSSQSAKDEFLKQLETIVDGVKNNKVKLEKKKQEEKMKRDQYNDQHLNLLEKSRLYFKTVKDFQEECRKNEILLSKLEGVAD